MSIYTVRRRQLRSILIALLIVFIAATTGHFVHDVVDDFSAEFESTPAHLAGPSDDFGG